MGYLKILGEGVRPQIVGHVSIPNKYYYSKRRVYFYPPASSSIPA